MNGYLLDANVLIALLWPPHEHHLPAQRWFAERAQLNWATCNHTELAFLRVVSNPAFSTDAAGIRQTAAVLASNLEHPGHRRWDAAESTPDLLAPFLPQMTGYRQLSDAYLLGVARANGGRLATFDRGIPELLPPDGNLNGLVELIEPSSR